MPPKQTVIAPTRQAVLEKLTDAELRKIVDAVPLDAILAGLSRDRLKELCRALDLDDSGRMKADLVKRLVGKPVLIVRQPWAWAIVSGGKCIENRTWNWEFRGQIWIHAGKTPEDPAMVDEMCGLAADEKGVDPARIRARYERERELGKIIGSVEVVDVVKTSDSRWFDGPYGFVLHKPVRLPEPIPLQGRLGIFHAALPSLP